MSSYYLCDTCGNKRKEESPNWLCIRLPHLVYKLAISDNQTPHDVCPYWKPKEEA